MRYPVFKVQIGLHYGSAILLTLASVFPREAAANELRGIIRNNRGASQFTKGKTHDAYEQFTRSLVDLPFAGEVHYNLGNSFLVNKEYEKALSEYGQAIRLSPGDSDKAKQTRFLSLFNSAVALTELKRVEEALQMYQEALELQPNSIETKTNMEILSSQPQGGGDGEQQKQQQDKGDKKNDKQKGDGKDDQKDDQKNDQNKDQNKNDQQQPKQQEKQKPKPKPFDSKEMSEQDMNRILEEIKRQEEQIRAKSQREGAKEVPPDKDW